MNGLHRNLRTTRYDLYNTAEPNSKNSHDKCDEGGGQHAIRDGERADLKQDFSRELDVQHRLTAAIVLAFEDFNQEPLSKRERNKDAKNEKEGFFIKDHIKPKTKTGKSADHHQVDDNHPYTLAPRKNLHGRSVVGFREKEKPADLLNL